jgi:hypothetical protein
MARYGSARISTRHAAAPAALACPACGHEPATRGEALQQRKDLAIIWLHLDGDHLTETRHCQACQPHEHIIDVSCSCCGNGPLITGQPPELGDQLPAPALEWLHARGWQLHPNRYVPKITDSQGIKPPRRSGSCTNPRHRPLWRAGRAGRCPSTSGRSRTASPGVKNNPRVP